MTAPTPADIDAIRERRSKITPPPWYVVDTDDDYHMCATCIATEQFADELGRGFDRQGKVIAVTLLQTPPFAYVDDGLWDENAHFIAHAPSDIGTLLTAIRERDDTIERLTREAAIWDAQAGARHADVTALQAEVARLTAERDEALRRGFDVACVAEWLLDLNHKPADLAFTEGAERQAATLCEVAMNNAAAKERKRCVAEIDDRIRGWQEFSSSGARKRVLELQSLKRDLLSDRTIARGEPQGIQQGQ